ncbi:hypothetical protein [Dechloromonas sp. A34]|uniref:hypothetical protein n=1 Tax=Dechloromonas sp. A34 TaxID=447588 RepID=UPI0022492C10|nr:hypothetical protein [Dechloromonas sp. A34]
MNTPDFTLLNEAGLNLQAIFNIDTLPAKMKADIRQRFDTEQRYRQLILIGHGGKAMWTAMKAAGVAAEHPIDQFSIAITERWLGGLRHAIVYPAETSVGLQALGKLAGWHHASPFMVGINETWGSWYAYRVVVLTDSDFVPTPPQVTTSPCTACLDQPCLAACPAGALNGGFDLQKCIAYRKTPTSRCKATCVARITCPVASDHRYSDEQIAHTYSISMRMIERYYD